MLSGPCPSYFMAEHLQDVTCHPSILASTLAGGLPQCSNVWSHTPMIWSVLVVLSGSACHDPNRHVISWLIGIWRLRLTLFHAKSVHWKYALEPSQVTPSCMHDRVSVMLINCCSGTLSAFTRLQCCSADKSPPKLNIGTFRPFV